MHFMIDTQDKFKPAFKPTCIESNSSMQSTPQVKSNRIQRPSEEITFIREYEGGVFIWKIVPADTVLQMKVTKNRYTKSSNESQKIIVSPPKMGFEHLELRFLPIE